MKKKLFIMAVVSLMVCLIGFGGVAYACPHDKHKECMSKPEHGRLCLYQKIPGEITSPLNDQNWEIDPDGAWGKMKYNSSGPIFNFEFEGHGLLETGVESGDSYTLIYYPDNFSGGLIYLGSDIADKKGHVHIKGSLDTGNLPAPYDQNYYTNPPGAKIWLVLSSDICFRNDPSGTHPAPHMIKWSLDKYLFEEVLINFTDTDIDPEKPWETDCAYW